MSSNMLKKFAELRKFIAPELVFGVGALELVGQYVLNFGAKKGLLSQIPGLKRLAG